MKIAATAANESWKPASKTRYGFHASSTIAPTSSAYHASRSRPAIHASEASEPAIPARTTDGCAPTARTYAAIPASAPSSPIQRLMPASHASTSIAAGDQDHVLSRDGQEVVEPRGAEVLAQVVGERLVVAEHDPFEDRAPFSREPGRDRLREPPA